MQIAHIAHCQRLIWAVPELMAEIEIITDGGLPLPLDRCREAADRGIEVGQPCQHLGRGATEWRAPNLYRWRRRMLEGASVAVADYVTSNEVVRQLAERLGCERQ